MAQPNWKKHPLQYCCHGWKKRVVKGSHSSPSRVNNHSMVWESFSSIYCRVIKQQIKSKLGGHLLYVYLHVTSYTDRLKNDCTVPAVLEVTGRETPSHLVSQRKSSIEGLRSGRLSCCSLTSCKGKQTNSSGSLSAWNSHHNVYKRPSWMLTLTEVQPFGHDSEGTSVSRLTHPCIAKGFLCVFLGR